MSSRTRSAVYLLAFAMAIVLPGVASGQTIELTVDGVTNAQNLFIVTGS